MKKVRFIFYFFFVVFSALLHANIVDTYEFTHIEERERAVSLAKSLRCPQCQNQNLVESTSPIAYDLRMEVYKMVDEGKTNPQIIATMTARFGDFVLYDPPFNWHTALLWLLPLFIFIGALGYLFYLHKIERPQHNTTYRTLPPKEDLHPRLTQLKTCSSARYIGLFLGCCVVVLPLAFYVTSERFNEVRVQSHLWQQAKQKQAHATSVEKNDHFIVDIQQKLRLNPNDGEAWFELGQAYALNNEFEHALESYRRATYLLGEQSFILSAMASIRYYMAGQKITPDVKRLLNKALAKDADDPTSLILLAEYAFLTTDYTQAIALWEQVLNHHGTQIDRRSVIQNIHLAQRLQQMKKPTHSAKTR